MSDRTGIFAGDDPFAIARNWLAEAEKTEINDPNAIALAPVDPPVLRYILPADAGLKDPVAGLFVYEKDAEEVVPERFVVQATHHALVDFRFVAGACDPGAEAKECRLAPGQ